jgi:hypothetical protein
MMKTRPPWTPQRERFFSQTWGISNSTLSGNRYVLIDGTNLRKYIPFAIHLLSHVPARNLVSRIAGVRGKSRLG